MYFLPGISVNDFFLERENPAWLFFVFN